MRNIKKQPAIILLEKRYDVIFATRNFEIKLFWQRSLFFWGFIAAAFVAFAAFQSKENFNTPLSIIISLFGIVTSFSWFLCNRGNKYWQEKWETELNLTEKEVTGELFNAKYIPKKECYPLFSAKRYSVSKLTICLSFYMVIFWFILFIYSLSQSKYFKTLYDSYAANCCTSIILFIELIIFTVIWLFFIHKYSLQHND